MTNLSLSGGQLREWRISRDSVYRPMPSDIVRVLQIEELFEVVEITEIGQLARLIEISTDRITEHIPWEDLSLYEKGRE